MKGERAICVLIGLLLSAAGVSAWGEGDHWLALSMAAAAAFAIATPFVPARWRA